MNDQKLRLGKLDKFRVAGIGLRFGVALPASLGAKKIVKTVTASFKPEDLSLHDRLLWEAGEWGIAATVGMAASARIKEAFDGVDQLVTLLSQKTEEDPTIIDGEIVSD